MTILYFLGPSDTHRIETPRPIQFTRADDEPHPYAHVSQEEAQAIAADASDLFAIKGALLGNVAPSDRLTVADLDVAVVVAKKPARKTAKK